MKDFNYWIKVLQNLTINEYTELLQAIQDYNDMKRRLKK